MVEKLVLFIQKSGLVLKTGVLFLNERNLIGFLFFCLVFGEDFGSEIVEGELVVEVEVALLLEVFCFSEVSVELD